MKFYIQTLGCRLNQAESQDLVIKLQNLGWQETKQAKFADLIILNTCVVTKKAERETRKEIRKLRKQNSQAKLAVAGCWVDKIKNFGGIRPDGIDVLVGNSEKWGRIIKNVRRRVNSNKEKRKTENIFNGRRLIKIQTGCTNACSYCLPYLIRGKPKSVPTNQIVNKVKRAIKFGALEIILTGQNISQYNDKGKDWMDLIRQVLERTDIKLLRLGSINPMFRASVNPRLEGLQELGVLDNTVYIDERSFVYIDKVISLFQDFPDGRLARHLHFSLQSGSDRILKLMNRRYRIQQYSNLVLELKCRVPNINITTDIIVGFPGETEKDFQKTFDLCKKLKFGKIHIFRYSPRSGTLAFQKQKQWGRVPERIIKKRAEKLAKLERQLRLEFYQSQIGQELKAKIWGNRGLTDNYIPVTTLISPDKVCVRKGLVLVPLPPTLKRQEVNYRFSCR